MKKNILKNGCETGVNRFIFYLLFLLKMVKYNKGVYVKMKSRMLKRNSKKGLIITCLILLVLGLSLGYALLTQTLTTRGTATVAKTTWNITFANPVVSSGSVSSALPTISDDGATVSYTVNMASPGQYYEFVVDVVNNGTIDAKLSAKPTISNLSAEQAAYLNYSATYSDDSTIEANDALSVGEIRKLKIRIEYKLDVDTSILPTENTNVVLTFAMNYIQA